MQDTLIGKLHDYIRQNNPDLLLTLEEQAGVTAYLSGKVDSITNL